MHELYFDILQKTANLNEIYPILLKSSVSFIEDSEKNWINTKEKTLVEIGKNVGCILLGANLFASSFCGRDTILSTSSKNNTIIKDVFTKKFGNNYSDLYRFVSLSNNKNRDMAVLSTELLNAKCRYEMLLKMTSIFSMTNDYKNGKYNKHDLRYVESELIDFIDKMGSNIVKHFTENAFK